MDYLQTINCISTVFTSLEIFFVVFETLLILGELERSASSVLHVLHKQLSSVCCSKIKLSRERTANIKEEEAEGN